MRVCDFCFVSAALAALTGMGLGVHMGLAGDFTLAPAHAHLNLLGWVTMALYGLHHRVAARTRAWPGSVVAWAQAGCGAAGFMAMAGGLAAYLGTGERDLIGVVIAGSLLSVASMAMFFAIVVADLLRARSRRVGAQGASRTSLPRAAAGPAPRAPRQAPADVAAT